MKVVIAGSSSLQNEMKKWFDYWSNKKGYKVLDHPIPIPLDKFNDLYPEVHIKFYKNISEANILFVANEKKKDINGYIGAETFAELAFGLSQKLIYKKDIKLILANMPDKNVSCYDEIVLWNKLGWIDEIMNKHN